MIDHAFTTSFAGSCRRVKFPLGSSTSPFLRLALVLFCAATIGCGRGREARLQDVLDRARGSSEHIVDLESPYMKDSDPDVRALAVWAMGDSKNPDAVGAVAALAGDHEPSVRLAVARALCRLGQGTLAQNESDGSETQPTSPAAGQDGAEANRPTSPETSAPADRPLENAAGERIDARDVPLSEQRPKGEDGRVGDATIAPQPAQTPSRESDEGAPKPSTPAPGPGLDALVALSQDSDTDTRREVIRCFAEAPAPPSGIFPRALLDTDKNVRALALAALMHHPEIGSLPQLRAAFESKDLEEQVAAVAAIRALKDPEAIPLLEGAASSRLSASVREAVESAILELRATTPPDGESGGVVGQGKTSTPPAKK